MVRCTCILNCISLNGLWRITFYCWDCMRVSAACLQLCSEIQCAWCKRSLFIFEPAWDLSLPLPLIAQRVSLNDLLEDFFGAEELDFSCSSCHTAACKAHRTIRYTHPPRVLLLQIKRFSASGQKRRTRVEFPLDELVMKTKGFGAHCRRN